MGWKLFLLVGCWAMASLEQNLTTHNVLRPIFSEQVKKWNLSSRALAPWAEYDSAAATLRVHFLTSSQTKFEAYRISLYNATDSSDCHTEIEVRRRSICYSRAARYNCDQETSKNETTHTIEFPYIYSGNYCLQIIGNESIPIINPYYLNLETSRNEADSSAWVPHVDIRRENDSDIAVDFFVSHNDFNYKVLEIELYYLGNLDVCQATYNSMYDRRIIKLPDGNENKDFNELITFPNRSDGFYCIMVTPVDERCSSSYSATHKPCTYGSKPVHIKGFNRSFGIGYPIKTYTTHQPVVTFIIVIVIVLFSIGALVFTISKRVWIKSYEIRELKKRKENQITEEKIPINTTTAELLPLLFLYAKGNQQLNNLITQLKITIQRRITCVIHDWNSEKEWNNTATEGVSWFTSRLNEKEIRIIVIHSPEMALCERLCSNSSTERHTFSPDENVDQECLFGLKQLLTMAAIERFADKRIFTVKFHQIPDTDISTLLTPFKCYELPQHLDVLVEHVLL